MTYLNHVTIDTGHTRRSPRQEVADDAIAPVDRMISRSLASGIVSMEPEALSHYAIGMRVFRGILAATIYVGGPEPMPIVTAIVARRARGADAAWVEAWAAADRPAPPPPSVPWLAARLHGAAIYHRDAMRWLADFERVLAWAWIERREAADGNACE